MAAVEDEQISVYDEVEIEDMTWDEALQIFHYPCPCGDRFEIALADLKDTTTDIAVCPSCSLMIRVIYDVVGVASRSSSLLSPLSSPTPPPSLASAPPPIPPSCFSPSAPPPLFLPFHYSSLLSPLPSPTPPIPASKPRGDANRGVNQRATVVLTAVFGKHLGRPRQRRF